MKKFLLVLFLLFFTLKVFAQQFSLYNTGTLYDSFENPSQRAFIPDSSKKFASNLFVPNFNLNIFLSGDAQATIKSRLFLNQYNNTDLEIGKDKYNIADASGNVYILMLKMFSSLSGDEELGFSWQLKTEGKAFISDESFAALNGPGSFTGGQQYNNIFNSNYYYQTYNQFSFTYREKFGKQVTFGVKLSALMGVQYQKLNISGSNVVFDKTADTALVGLKGVYAAGYIPGHFVRRDYLPSLRSPGAGITMGSTYRTEDGYIIQGNVKDLGFIHWSGLSRTYNFNNSVEIGGLTSPQREDSIYNKVSSIIHNSPTQGSFTSPIDGRAELSISKSYWLDEDNMFKYSPTLVASKELFYKGFIGALVNPIQYQKYVLTLTTTYDDLKDFNLGAQFTLKTPNFEFYVGSDKIAQNISLTSDALSTKAAGITQNNAFTGASFFLGVSIKFGPPIEHPMNASIIPTGEKGFLARLWGRLFPTND